MSDSFAIAQRPAPRSASTTRRGAEITLIVVHLSQTPDDQALAAYTATDASSAPHYYIGANASITQLVSDDRAANHSGTARLGNRSRNIDRISIGIVVGQAGRVARNQSAALNWLVDQIRAKYGLFADAAILLWNPPTAGQTEGTLTEYRLPVAATRQAVLSVEDSGRRAVLGIEDDPAAAQRLWIFLQTESAKPRNGNFNLNSAFHLHAAKNGMGAAISASSPRSAWISINGQTFNYQHFACDTAFNEGENWGAVQNLSARLQGSFPAPGSVEYELLKSAYAAGISGSKPTTGNTNFNPGWASTQFAAQNRLGPALSGAYRITVAGSQYTVQVFGADTLYTPIANPESGTNWGAVLKMTDAPAGDLRNALWAESYKPSGAPFDPNNAFFQAAAAAKIGAPLTAAYSATFEGTAITLQVFALDTLYQAAGGAVKRKSALPQPAQVTGWVPKAANPIATTPPQTQPTTIPAGNVIVPGGDKNSPDWPQPPANIKPLYSTEDRQRIFGKFDYVSAPVPGNPEKINILGTWQQDNIIPVAIPQLAALAGRGVRGAPKSGTVLWHKLAVKQLLGLWAAWEQAKLLDRIVSFDGAFNARFIRGSTTNLSNHAFGTAFDINASLNMLGQVPARLGQTGCVRELVAYAWAYGFYWGGNFGSGRSDGMHFEIATVM